MIGFSRKYISAADQESDDALVAMKDAVRNAQKNNPFVVFEATGNDLVYGVFDIAKNDEGVHLEKAFGIIGSLAGFSCAIVAGLRSEDASAEERAAGNHVAVRTRAGETLFFGDYINAPLIDNHHSFYRMIASKAATLGATSPYDLNDLFQHHASNAGSPVFGLPRMPKGRALDARPLTYIIDYWPELLPILNRYDETYENWPISWGAAGAQLLDMAKDIMPAKDGLQIMMECAVPMSKLGPSRFVQPATHAAE